MAKLFKQPVRKHHRRRWAIGILVLLVIIAAGAMLYVWQVQTSSKNDANKKASEEKTYTIQDEIDTAKDQLAKAKTKDEKLKGYQDLTNLYVNTSKNTSEAIETAKKMVELDPSNVSYAQLGFAYAMNEDYKAAATNYRKAADLSSPKVDDARTDYGYYLREAKTYEKME